MQPLTREADHALLEYKSILPPEVVDIVESWYYDIGKFAKDVFPSRFRNPYTIPHMQLIDFINDAEEWQRKRKEAGLPCGLRLAVAGARGLAKTSFIQYAWPIRKALFQEIRCYVPVTKSEGNTTLQTNNLKREVLQNDIIRQLVGSVKPLTGEMRESFGTKAYVMDFSGHLLLTLPRGRTQEVRGVIFGDWRPDFLSLDDMLTKKEVRNPEIRVEVEEYIDTDVLGCVDQLESENAPWTIIASDTIKHADYYLEKLLRDPDWEGIRIPVATEDGKVVDPEFMSQETYDGKLNAARRKGTLDLVMQEYMARPGSKEDAPFKKEDFRYYKESTFTPPEQLVNFVLVDPARTVKATSDDTAMIVWGIDTEAPAFYLREILQGKFTDDQQALHAARLCHKYNAELLGVELAGLGLYGATKFKDMLAYNKLFNVRFEDCRAQGGRGELSGIEGGKIGRARPLSAYYQWHIIYHNEECKAIYSYEMNLLEFPTPPEWHSIDAAAYLLQMLDKLGIRIADGPVFIEDNGTQREGRFPDKEDVRAERGSTSKDAELERLLEDIYDDSFTPMALDLI